MKNELKKALLVGGASAVLAMGTPAVAQDKKTEKKVNKIEKIDAAARRTVGTIKFVEIVRTDTPNVVKLLYHVNDFNTGETRICSRIVNFNSEVAWNFPIFAKVEVIEIYNPKLGSWEIYQINKVGSVKPENAPVVPNKGNQR